jgi:hypothetical protein
MKSISLIVIGLLYFTLSVFFKGWSVVEVVKFMCIELFVVGIPLLSF